MAEPDFAALRRDMVDRQVAARGIDDPRLLDAFRAVPRELFVAPQYAARAYDDGPLPIGEGQTISQPYIVALMIAAAEVSREDRVLEVGAGSGYAAAILGQVAHRVIAIERHGNLAASAKTRIERLGYANVEISVGDGTHGWPEAAPYDAILASATGGHVPPALVEQLKPGGRLLMPLGNHNWSQALVKFTKSDDGGLTQQTLCGVRFVPLIGAE